MRNIGLIYHLTLIALVHYSRRLWILWRDRWRKLFSIWLHLIW